MPTAIIGEVFDRLMKTNAAAMVPLDSIQHFVKARPFS
jgi:hypothetical protein